MIREYLNFEEFKIAGEIPLLIKLRLHQLFTKRTAGATGRILVVDTCIIGDFIATLPALRLFIQRADRDVDLIVAPQLRSIAESIIGVHAVYTARSIYKRTIETRSVHTTLPRTYDLILVLRISSDAFQMLKGVHYASLISYDIYFFRYFAHIFWSVLFKRDVRQWREINFDIVGIREPARHVMFNEIFSVSDTDINRIRALPEMSGTRKRVIIHTGSGWHIKLWDNDKWAETIRQIDKLGDFDFIFIGSGEMEAQSLAYIQQRLDVKVKSLVNKVDLKTTLLVMRLSDYFIGIDSGPRNMAHLADLRSITLHGPAPKNFLPTNKNDIVINKFTCRCKSLFYFHRTSALSTLSADEVVEGFKKLSSSTAAAKPASRIANF
jgi:ADP-heptose:LPS heptosyltransferase